MNQTDQVVQLYETGADPKVIADAMGLNETLVTTILMSKSRAFQKAQRQIDPAKPLADQMLDVMVDLAQNSDNEFIRLRAATTVRDDLKGRRDHTQLDATSVGAAILTLGQRFSELANRKKEFIENRAITVN